jgi:hypothetical protein
MALGRICFILLVVCLLISSSSLKSIHWLLHARDEMRRDCFVVDTPYVCRSEHSNNIDVFNTSSSCYDGTSWAFSSLKEIQVTTSDLIDWLIPFDIIEQYTEYLSETEPSSLAQRFIFNCSLNGFSKECEYSSSNFKLLTSGLLVQQSSRSNH